MPSYDASQGGTFGQGALLQLFCHPEDESQVSSLHDACFSRNQALI